MTIIDVNHLLVVWNWDILQYRKFRYGKRNSAGSVYLQILPLEIVVWWPITYHLPLRGRLIRTFALGGVVGAGATGLLMVILNRVLS